MKVLVTGSDGFIGKNLVSQLRDRKGFEIIGYDTGFSETDLQEAIAQVEFICHFAGVNRPDDASEFSRVNTGLTETLCDLVKKSHRKIPIIFSSSIQVDRNNPYGISKLAAENILLEYSRQVDVPVYVFRLPNVFGKWCRPNYNSVVATFCYNIVHGLPIQINDPAYRLKLVYIDDLVEEISRLIPAGIGVGSYCEVGTTYEITVGELAEVIRSFKSSRNSLVSPRVGSGLVRALYSTYVSYLPPQDFVYSVPKHGDPRGIFVEMLKTQDSGQFSFFTAHPGVTRGGHYHHSKTEKFLVIQGKAKFRFRHMLTNECHELLTSGDNPQIVDTIPGWTHDITNIGETEMIVMLWANEIFDRSHPDTYACPV